MAENNTKPFICPEEGCDMTFTNKDHLDWHKKKHDMMLNLGLTNSKNGEIADQTPTPTRFIRNCEEVGLFQDLQNNPFDEIFKKATENVEAGRGLHVPQPSGDDTLHTPQIYPQAEQAERGPAKFENCGAFSLVIDGDDKRAGPKTAIVKPADGCGGDRATPRPVISAMKKKIREAMISKKCTITPVPLHRLRQMKDVDRVREMNRAAQERCRQRRAKRWSEMEDELQRLRRDNERLRRSNAALERRCADMQAAVVGNVLQQAKTQLNGINIQQTSQSTTSLPSVTTSMTTVAVPTIPQTCSTNIVTPTTPVLSLPPSISSQIAQLAPAGNPVMVIVAPGGAMPIPLVQLQSTQFQSNVPKPLVQSAAISSPVKDTNSIHKQLPSAKPVLKKLSPKNKKVIPKLKIGNVITPKVE